MLEIWGKKFTLKILIDGTKNVSTSHEPFNVINLDIPNEILNDISNDAYNLK